MYVISLQIFCNILIISAYMSKKVPCRYAQKNYMGQNIFENHGFKFLD
jgi:hypothetical protein